MNPRPPSYRLHKPTGQAVVTLNGRDSYLGRHGTPASRAEYDRLIAEWLANGRRSAGQVDLSVDEVLLAFWRHAESHYKAPDDSTTNELLNFRHALKPLRALYGKTPASSFGPLALRAVRDVMVASRLARPTVNARINRVRRMFKWAASVELVPASVVQGLATVAGLQRGRTEAPEPKEIGPVPIEHVEVALPFLSRPVAAMVRLQLLTGCRAGEVMAMKGRDVAFGEPCGEYRPSAHKNAWRGRDRVIPLGPKAQAIVREFLRPDPDAYLFDPRVAVADHHAGRRAGRETRATPAEVARRRESPGADRNPCYSRASYRNAVVRACLRAGVPAWSPLHLRHTAATAIRAQYGLEASQVVLGHAKADVTQLYAERDLDKARDIMREVG